MKNALKIIALLFTALFIAAAAVQYNDPDSIQWIVVYGIAALLSFRVAFRKIPPILVTFAAAVFLIWGIVTWPENFVGISLDSGDITSVEEGREALGLLVTGAVFAFYTFALRKS